MANETLMDASPGTGTFETNLEANIGERTSVYSSGRAASIAGAGAEASMVRVSLGSLGRD
jgi:hypothetical protein